MAVLEKNVAGQTWLLYAYEDGGGTTPGAPVTGDAANITAKIRKDSGTASATNDTNPTEIEDGYYELDLTQAETNADYCDILPESATANVQVIGVPGRVHTVAPNYNAMSVSASGRLDIESIEGIDATDQIRDSVVDDATKIDGSALNILSGHDPGENIAGTSEISGLNDLSAADVNAEVDTALSDIHLDHLFSVQYDSTTPPGASGALWNVLTEDDGGTPRFTTNALEQGPTEGGDSAATIADAVWDEATADHTAVSSTGEAIGNLDATISSRSSHGDPDPNGYISNLNGHTPQTGDTYGELPSNFSTFSITASGRVDVESIEGLDATDQVRDAVVDDATRIDASALNTLSGHDPGETIAGSSQITGLNDISTAEVNTEVDNAIETYGLDHLLSAAVAGTDITDDSIIAQIVSSSGTADWDTFDNTTDSLQALRDRGDSDWITATGFSTHSQSDVWSVATRELTSAANITSTGSTLYVDGSGHVKVEGTITTLDGLNDLSAAEVNSQMDTALSDIHLDHLLATSYDSTTPPGASGALWNILTEDDSGEPRFTVNALENAPSDSGASAETIADAVWDEATGDHTSAGSTGEAVNHLDADISSRSSHGDPDPNGYISNLNGHTAQSGDTYGALPTNFSHLSITVTTGRVDVGSIEGTDATNQIRDSVVDDATLIDASALNTLSGHDPEETIAGSSQITGLNDLSAAEVNSEVDTALSDIHLDHLFAIDYDPASPPGVGTAILNELVESDGGVARFTANTLEEAPTGSGVSADSIADAVWDETQADHTTAGSTGEAIGRMDATVSSRSSHDDPDPNGYISNLQGHTAQSGDSFSVLPTNFSQLWIQDGSGYVRISGTKNELDDMNDVSQTQVNSQVDTALTDYDAVKKSEMDSAVSDIKGENDKDLSDVFSEAGGVGEGVVTITESSVDTSGDALGKFETAEDVGVGGAFVVAYDEDDTDQNNPLYKAVTDGDGGFELNVLEGATYQIVFIASGYEKVTKNVEV